MKSRSSGAFPNTGHKTSLHKNTIQTDPMKYISILCAAFLSLNLAAETLINETFTGVKNGRKVLQNPTDKGDYWVEIPGADNFTKGKLDANFNAEVLFKDMSVKGSDGMALTKVKQDIGMDLVAPMPRPIDLTKAGEIVVTYDYMVTVTDQGNQGWLSFEMKGEDGEAAFKIRPSGQTALMRDATYMPMIEFWIMEEEVFGTEALASSLAPIGKDSPEVHVYCLIEYNKTPGTVDATLSYSFDDENTVITKKVTGLPMPAQKTIKDIYIDNWGPAIYWMDNIVVTDNPPGTEPRR